jgi:hypothetical protein
LNNFEKFLDNSARVHGTRYDYSKFIYTSAKTPGIIICREPGHGEFLQKPDNHTRKDAIGCPICVTTHRTRVLSETRLSSPELFSGFPKVSKEDYLTRFTSKYGDKFEVDLSNYEGITSGSVTITCSKHGKSTYLPSAPLNSSFGCKECGVEASRVSKIKGWDRFLEDVDKVHPGKYTFPESNRITFRTRRDKVHVVCPKHGPFIKKGQKLLSGQGCYQCTLEDGILEGKYPGGYGYDLFSRVPEMAVKPATLYYLRLDNLFKIGITVSRVARRIYGLRNLSKNGFIESEILMTLETTLEEAYNIEQYILEKHSADRVFRQWSTELFNTNVLVGTTLSAVRDNYLKHTPIRTSPATP